MRVPARIRGQRAQPAPLISTMDDVRGVELVDVTLPREPASDPTTRTVQASVHPNLVRHYTQPTYPLRVATIPDGRLALSGGVVTSEGQLVLESLWDEPHYQRDFARPRRLRPATRLGGVGASLISLWCDNYFHWIFNSLPRLAVLDASGVEFDYLIVPERLKPFQTATLQMLGYASDRLVPYTGEHVQVERLVWAAPLAPINEPSGYLLSWVRDHLRPRTAEPVRRLYVSRRGGTRRAVNEDEVFSALEPQGFQFVLPEEHSFADQVQLFAEARIAVGPHGSNFVNGIFSDHLSVVECFQQHHVNWGVYSVLCAAGVDHWSILCADVRRRGAIRFSDLEIPLPDLMRSLARIETEAGPTQERSDSRQRPSDLSA